jgi:hypothetical protein
MKRSRRHRTARKLVLPLIAIALMTTMMSIGSGNHADAQTAAPTGASQR